MELLDLEDLELPDLEALELPDLGVSMDLLDSEVLVDLADFMETQDLEA